MTRLAELPARWRDPLSGSADRGFLAGFLAIAAALLLLPAIPALVASESVGRLAVTGTGGLVVAVAFLWRPKPTLLAFALYILFYETIAGWLGPGVKQIDEVSIPLMFAITLVRVRPFARRRFSVVREGGLAVAVAFGVASSLVNGVPLQVWTPELLLLVKGIGVFYIASWLDFTPADIRHAAIVVLAVGSAVLLLGLIEFINPVAFQRTLGLHELVRPRGTLPSIKSLFFHPILFGWFTTFIALYAYAHFLTFRRWWMLAVALAFSLGPFLAARRRAIAALAAGLAAALLWHLQRTRSLVTVARAWVPVAIANAVLVVVFLPGLVGLYDLTVDQYLPEDGIVVTPPGEDPPVVVTPTDDDEGPRVIQAREALYRGSVEIARDYFPLGGGLGRYGSWMSRVEYSPLYVEYGLSKINGLRPANPRFATDTFWPQILGELGVFGLLAYLLFLGSIGYLLWRESQRDAEPIVRAFRLGTLLIFAQALVESLASAMFHSPSRAYLVLAAAGVVASLAWRDRRDAAAT